MILCFDREDAVQPGASGPRALGFRMLRGILKLRCNRFQVQVALFSATMAPDILDLTSKFMRNPVRILVKKDELTLEGIRQFYIAIEKEDWKLGNCLCLASCAQRRSTSIRKKRNLKTILVR